MCDTPIARITGCVSSVRNRSATICCCLTSTLEKKNGSTVTQEGAKALEDDPKKQIKSNSSSVRVLSLKRSLQLSPHLRSSLKLFAPVVVWTFIQLLSS